MIPAPVLRVVALAFVLLGVSGCSALRTSLFGGVPDTLDSKKVPAAITTAEQALAHGDAVTALDWMRAASKTTGLAPEVRDHIQVLLEQAAQKRVEQLSAPGSNPDDLADLVDLDLPRQIAVDAGLAAAKMYVANGKPMDAYKLLKKLDTKFPLHHRRVEAGDMLADIGLSLKDDNHGFWGFFETVDEAEEIMEYVILQAPWAKRCDECYAALSVIYADDRSWHLAIERAEGLVLNHPGSPLRPAYQARIPKLRLRDLASTEYDRSVLSKARGELQEWLVTYPGHELEYDVRLDLADCLRRLSDNDWIISKFYKRVDNAFGARRHAERALEEAKDAGDEERMSKLVTWIARLPPAKNPLTGSETLP